MELVDFAGKLNVRRENILFFERASIHRTLTVIAPILYLSKCIVKYPTTDFGPLNECLLLNGVWIDSLTVSKRKHSSIIRYLLDNNQPLNINYRDIESL